MIGGISRCSRSADPINRVSMTAVTTENATERAYSRATLVAGAALAVFIGGGLFLWARHGSAVFHEIIVAGLALCF